jgi:hypothetical protein
MADSDRLIDSPLDTLSDGDKVRIVKEAEPVVGARAVHPAGAKTD